MGNLALALFVVWFVGFWFASNNCVVTYAAENLLGKRDGNVLLLSATEMLLSVFWPITLICVIIYMIVMSATLAIARSVGLE
jgi:hypothetical protein